MGNKEYLNECAPFVPLMTMDNADVLVVTVNPFQVDAFTEEKSEWLDNNMPGVKNFVKNNYELNNLTMNTIGNFSTVFSNGRVLCFLWAASIEDKALCLMKIDNFFRTDYRFYDVCKNIEILRLNKDTVTS